MDKNLKKTRHDLVPEMINEDEFWRNYFYKIECAKAELGVETKLGPRKSNEEMVKQLSQREAQLAEADSEAGKSPAKIRPEGEEIEMQTIQKNEKVEESKTIDNTVEDDEEAEIADLKVQV